MCHLRFASLFPPTMPHRPSNVGGHGREPDKVAIIGIAIIMVVVLWWQWLSFTPRIVNHRH